MEAMEMKLMELVMELLGFEMMELLKLMASTLLGVEVMELLGVEVMELLKLMASTLLRVEVDGIHLVEVEVMELLDLRMATAYVIASVSDLAVSFEYENRP
ncbi:hypothetical protein Dimus_027601 [Dionaea muscipula]